MNPQLQELQDLLAQYNHIPVLEFVINLVLVTLLSFLLGHVYVRYGTSLSNRKMFARNFILIAMVTMLVISVVKSSLALSLGLVGALSIVRFRAAIKEPEELAYLFFAIALGLGFGANQGLITTIAFVIICIVLTLIKRQHSSDHDKNLYITVTTQNPDNIELQKIVNTLSEYCPNVDVKRFDAKKDLLEASFIVDFQDFGQFNQAQSALRKLDDSIEITFLDQRDFVV